MKITVFEGEPETAREKEVCLRLISSGLRGLTTLAVVDPGDGKVIPGGYLMTIERDGIFRPCCAVSSSIGLPIDGTNRTVVIGQFR